MSSVLQFICVFFIYGMLHATDVQQPAEETESCYPKGSVACKMWNYTNMDCTYRKLVCIPPLHHADVIQSLDLSHNNLSIIPDHVFHTFSQLQHLDLCKNSVSTLQHGAFNGLHKLVTLDLSSNSIFYIKEDTFSSLGKLQDLNISFNYVSTIHDNAFSTNPNLLSLDLAGNQISVISEKTFSSQTRLTSLNLLGNSLVSLHGFPYHGLISLERLQLTQNLSSLSVTSLSGLEKLQNLFLTFDNGSDNVTSPPLVLLSSLTDLTIDGVLYNCDTIGKLFIGLQNLQHLDIRVGGSCPDIIFCSSYDKYSSECTNFLPLKSLNFYKESASTSLPAFNTLHTLNNLILNGVTISEAAKALIWLDSPLQELAISTTLDTAQSINSSMFVSWESWKASLQILSLYSASEILLEGAPFEWFTDLKQVSVAVELFQSPKLTLSVNTFIGLQSLQKLHLQGIPIDLNSLLTALNIFSRYNSLKTLDLSGNQLTGNFEALWETLCKISSLEKIDLSHNYFDFSLNVYWPCSPSNLKQLIIGYQNNMAYSATICAVSSQLESLDVGGTSVNILQPYFICPKLMTLTVSYSIVNYDYNVEMHVPNLLELFLNNLNHFNPTDIHNMLNIFKAPELQTLDLRSNGILNINNDLGRYLGNLSKLTVLDLSNNSLASVSNLHHLHNIRSLLLNGNLIKLVTNDILAQSSHPNINLLDLGNNPFQCDCNVMGLQNWILTDRRINVQKNSSQYVCFSPDRAEGFSVTQITLDCKSPTWKYIVSGIVCTIVLLITVLLMVHYRWHIKYRLFLLFNKSRYQEYQLINDDERIDDDETGVPRYDAYVPYHIDDEDWVDGELLANIEEGEEPFRLCLRRRDIRAGRPIFSELSLHIQRSRKILVILSPRFVEDNWCYFELNMAHHRVLEENRNVMIIIILEEVPDNKMTLLLRQLFCRVQYLKWPADGRGQYLFWRCLREELKRPVPLDRRFNI